MRVIYIHGNQTRHWSFGCAPWLKSTLEASGLEAFFETMPDSVLARREYWLPFLRDHVRVTANDVLLGWSSGAVAAMRFAESHPVRGSVLVAPSYTDTGDELERASGYFDDPWDWGAIRAHQRGVEVISGTADPYIGQDEFRVVAQNLRARWTSVPGAGHFDEREELPEAIEAVHRLVG